MTTAKWQNIAGSRKFYSFSPGFFRKLKFLRMPWFWRILHSCAITTYKPWQSKKDRNVGWDAPKTLFFLIAAFDLMSFHFLSYYWEPADDLMGRRGQKLAFWIWSIKVSYFKMSFWCLQIFQKTNEIFPRISAIASKKRSNQKNKGTLYH